MTAAPYTGRAVTQYRAACIRHQMQTDLLRSADEADWLAIDTRQFCPACQEEDREAQARRAGHVRRELERARGRPLAKVK